MKTNMGVSGQEGSHELRFIRGQVIENDVGLLTRSALLNDLLREGDELLAGVTRGRLTVYLACLGIQSGIGSTKSRGARPGWGLAAALVEPVQCLNGCFLIYAEDGGVLWQLQIQADDIGGFAFAVWMRSGL